MKTNTNRVLSEEQKQAVAVWNKPSLLLAMVFTEADVLETSLLPFKPSKGFESGVKNYKDPVSGTVVRIYKQRGALSNSVVLSHVDINMLLSTVSEASYGIPVTYDVIDDSAFPINGETTCFPYREASLLWYRYKSVERIVKGVEKLKESLFYEYCNVDTHNDWDGSNYIHFDGKEIIHVLYPK